MKRNWEYKKLSECGIVITGNTPSKKDAANYSSNDFCFVKPNDIEKDGITYINRTCEYISKKAFERSRRLSKGAVLTTCIGIIGKVAILEVDATCNQQINAIIPNADIDSRFLAYSILSIRNYLTQKANAPVVPIINKSDFSDILIPVPPLEEQSRIVAELDLLTGIIDKQNAQLKELDNLAQAIFYDMFGDPIENPKRWNVKNLGAVCDFKNGLNFAPDETGEKYYLIGVSDFQTKSRLECNETLKMIELSKPLGEEYLLSDDDILFVRSNGNKDLIARNVLVTTNGLKVTYSGFCIRARVKNDDVIPFFLNSLLKLPSAHNALTVSGHGCNIANLNQKTLDGFLLILPPLALQQSFAEKIQSIEKQKETIRASIADTQKLLDYTMDKYF